MSSVIEVSRPAAYPVSITEAIQFLKQLQLMAAAQANPITDPEVLLIQNVWIPAATRYIEDLTGLTLASRNFEQWEDGFPFFPYFQSPYAPLFGAAFPFYFGYGPIASYPYPAIGGLQNQMLSPFQKRLLKSPVTAVGEITYVGTDGQPHTLSPGTDFVVDLSSQPGRIAPLPGQRWPAGIIGQNTVKIPFTAGYSAVETDTEDVIEPTNDPPNEIAETKGDIGIPEQLKAAVLIMLGHLYNNREPVAGGTTVDVPHSVSAICAANRVWDFGPVSG